MTSTNPTMREQLALDIGAATEREGYLALVRVDNAGAAHSPPLSFGRVGATVAVVEMVGYIAGLEDELAESRAAHGRELETSIDLKTRLAAQSLQLAAARAIPAHTQAFIDTVRETLGSSMSPELSPATRSFNRLTLAGAALDKLDKAIRGAR